MKRVTLVLLAALVLLLVVPAAASAERPYKPPYLGFPKGSKITVNVGAPDAYGVCQVTLEWPSFSRPCIYSVYVYTKQGLHLDTQYGTLTTVTVPLPPGSWTVVVGAHDPPTEEPWRPGAALDSLKGSFSVP
jgi:hypothetical protein